MDRSVLITLVLVIPLGAFGFLPLIQRALAGLPIFPPKKVDELKIDPVEAEAERLWKSDPAAAARLLDSHYEKEGEREQEERAALRASAATDPAAAEELRRRLVDELDTWQMLLENSRKRAKKDIAIQKAVTNLEGWQQETRAQLAEVEDLIRQLHA